MSDSADLRKILKSWPYDPENDARIIRGDDGRDLLQVRTPLGIEQYEMDGRPDGVRPHGMESVLEYYQQRLNQAKFSGRESDFDLGPRECSELFQEGTLYYFRYVRLFQLKDWARTVRDTARNLRAFDFLHRHARREEDSSFWRSGVLTSCGSTPAPGPCWSWKRTPTTRPRRSPGKRSAPLSPWMTWRMTRSSLSGSGP